MHLYDCLYGGEGWEMKWVFFYVLDSIATDVRGKKGHMCFVHNVTIWHNFSAQMKEIEIIQRLNMRLYNPLLAN